jgi:micrococcal nuclease
MSTHNQPLLILVGGIAFVLLLAISLSPSVQGSVARLLDSSVFVDDVLETPNNDSSVEYGVVSRVVDGDTIVLEDGRDIRYLYVDTPETVKPGSPIECYGPESSRLNQILVESKEVVLLQDVENEDRFGRDLRLVFIKGVNYNDVSQSVNADLVQSGHARAAIYKPNDTYESEFLAYEQEAKESLQGLWLQCSDEE